ncbi:MAG: GntR family transcriptional regulator [Tissierellales bacterium]|nr:GntR family transcriptional regulator [Tissierellales bacterium]
MKTKIIKHSISDQVYHLLKENILSFNMKPGDKINIDELSTNLELSNTPIREAIKRLQQDGLVEQKLNSGFYVKKISKEESSDYSNIIKIMLLGSIEELIITNKIKDIIEKLEKQLDIQILAFENNDNIAFLKESIKFDQVFIKSLNNEVLSDKVEKLNEIFSFSVFAFHKDRNNKIKSINDHKKMIEAIKEDNYAKLKNVLRNHYVLGTSADLYED